MVNFCQKCGNLLIPQINEKKKTGIIDLFCRLCQKSEEAKIDEISYQIKMRIEHRDEEKSQVHEQDFSVDPTIRQVCPKCGYLEAYYWQGGDRRKSEWEPITYYRCVHCKHTWND